MATLNDGLVLIRTAEALADLGSGEMTDAALEVIGRLPSDAEAVALVEGHLPEDHDPREWLISLTEHARYVQVKQPEDIADVVECIAYLGNVVVSNVTHQATGSFPTLTTAG